ncbi:aspartate:alanine exchanger family transporter [Pseudovibrio sp. SPO723]|uniref:aspartate:alanine exchanger family transporter n=1 Tax=Nesiotobacter zosterae TaxID=392721 RepID=UPI0029C38B3C|nr:TrkA C-terminal domain-containing protein [Pseudovibrio sp. SPO723]MDX5595278.1 TrkA C-terminal domain-containing protein [Pseudovibrio sp. SPO723]
MIIDLAQLFHNNSLLVVFTIIAFGYLIGNIKIARFEIGVTGGVLLCALVFGHYNFQLDPIVQSLGFTLFIYSVGWQAGPQILNVLRLDGPRYLVLTLFMTAVSFSLVFGLAAVIDLPSSYAAGLMAGSLTSTPTLVGAQNAVTSGLVRVPEGATARSLIENISVAYAITYIFGTVGLLMVVRILPSILRVDLVAAALQFSKERGIKSDREKYRVKRPILRAYAVDDPDLAGKTFDEILSRHEAQSANLRAFYRLKRGSELIEPRSDTIVEMGDKVAVFATPEEHAEAHKLPGLTADILDEDLIDAEIDVAEIVITNPASVGKPLAEIGIYDKFGCFLSSLTRSQIQMPVSPGTVVQRGDVMIVSGERLALDRLIAHLGAEDRKAVETDLLTFAAGIVAGLIIGQITVKIGSIDIGLGNAGGLLLSGICVGFLRANRPTFGRMPAAARFIFMELGLLLFMVGVGLNAGGGIVGALASLGPILFACGVVVTCVPLLVGYAFGRFALNMNPALLFGALTGAMTSTPALGIVQQAAKSTVPALGYAGTYALANVLLTLAGTAIVML